MNLQDVIAEIKKQRSYQEADLSKVNPKTINSLRGRKESATAKLDELFFNYRKLVMPNILPILVLGEGSDEFLAIAKEETDLHSLGSNELYKKLASKIDQTILSKGRESSAFVIEVASNVLEQTAQEMGIASYPRMIYKSKYEGVVKTTQDAENLIRRVIVEDVGTEMATLFVLDHAARLSFKDVDTLNQPIGISVKTQEDLEHMKNALSKLGNKFVVITLGKELSNLGDVNVESIDKDSVLSALKETKNSVKGIKKTKTKKQEKKDVQ